jgi:hypothetical protein
MCRLDASGSGQGPVVVGCYVHGNEPSGSMKGEEFFEYLSGY